MSTELDVRVARAVYVTRLIERALHDHRASWEMSWGEFVVSAERSILDDGVRFVAVFPEHCYLEEPDPYVRLVCDGEVVAVKPMEFPGDGSFQIEWLFEMQVASEALA